MITAQPVKKINVNQSIKALTLRPSVGSANAASAASVGNASNKERCAELVVRVAATATSTNHSGSHKCRLLSRAPSN